MQAAFLLGFQTARCARSEARGQAVDGSLPVMEVGMQVTVRSEVISSILNCVCPDCGGSMGATGEEFRCRGECQTDWRPLWEQLLSAGFHSRSRKRSGPAAIRPN